MKNFYEIAVRIQDASNPVAVMGELREAMMAAHHGGNARKNPAVIAIFFKLYDMLGAPSEREMYSALKACETLAKTQTLSEKITPSKPVFISEIGRFGGKKRVTRRRK